MRKYKLEMKQKVRKLRKIGKTYTEINSIFDLKIPKSTLSNWCKDILLLENRGYFDKVSRLRDISLSKARLAAIESNRIKRQKYLDEIENNNLPIVKSIDEDSTALIALSMLCLGEASKSKTKHKSFTLGSSDPRIIVIFLTLLKQTSDFDRNKLRFTLQCRADQNIQRLEKYWRKVVKVPKSYFYPTRVDARTVGKPTKNTGYKGVLVVDYFNKRTQLMLESLADLIYNRLKSTWAHGAVG